MYSCNHILKLVILSRPIAGVYFSIDAGRRRRGADDLHGDKLTPWYTAAKKTHLIYPRTFAKYWTFASPEGPSRRKSRS